MKYGLDRSMAGKPGGGQVPCLQFPGEFALRSTSDGMMAGRVSKTSAHPYAKNLLRVPVLLLC
jgi:hypothetical protein